MHISIRDHRLLNRLQLSTLNHYNDNIKRNINGKIYINDEVASRFIILMMQCCSFDKTTCPIQPQIRYSCEADTHVVWPYAESRPETWSGGDL